MSATAPTTEQTASSWMWLLQWYNQIEFLGGMRPVYSDYSLQSRFVSSFTHTNWYSTRNTCRISIIRYICKAQNEEFVEFLAVLWISVNNLDVTLCSCMSKWADVPEVALVSLAKSDEPFSAWILCNNRGWAVSEKEIKHCVIDFKCRPLCGNQQSESGRESTLTSFSSKISTEDNFIESQVSRQHVLFQSVGWNPVYKECVLVLTLTIMCVFFWLKDN